MTTQASLDPFPAWKEPDSVSVLAQVIDAVVGVDTHRDTHSLHIAQASGVAIAEVTVGNDAAGYRQAIAWAREHAPGPRLVFAMEGTRSYGIGLARAVTDAGLPVVEIAPPARGSRRGKGKTDPIDAGLAVMAALRLDVAAIPTPRADGDREALRILLDARDEVATMRTRQVNRLRALLLTGDDTDRDLARGALTAVRLKTIAARPVNGQAVNGKGNRQDTVRCAEIHRLTEAIQRASRELLANARQLRDIVNDLAPTLLTRRGIGPVSAAQAIVSYSHPGRCRHDGAFASLAGTCPIPASSGKTIRWRLNRGGDRALNRATHTIALSRMTSCPRTRSYVARRRAEGKSNAEIRRCLKRYITRELFRLLNADMA